MRLTSILFGVVVLGIFLRFHALDRQSLWLDEMTTLETLSTPVRHWATSPLYFVQLKVWRALGFRSLVKLRANSAFWGVLGILFTALLARRYGGEKLAIVACAFLALSPFHLAYSQEITPFVMAMTIGVAALLALERQAWRTLAFLWTALLFTHYWGFFLLLAQLVYGWLTSEQRARKALMVSGLATFALFCFWLFLAGNPLGAMVSWVPSFSFLNLGKTFLAYSGLVFNMGSSVFYLPGKIWLHILMAAAFAASVIVGWRVSPRLARIALIIGLGVPWLLSFWKPAIFIWYREPLLLLPAFACLCAAGLLAMRPLWLRVLVLTLCFFSQAWAVRLYYTEWQKANPKAVVAYVHRIRQPATIVIRPASFAGLFHFYDQGTSTTLDHHVLDNAEKRKALKGKHVILISFDVPLDPITAALLKEFNPPSARYFPGTRHLGITVYEFTG